MAPKISILFRLPQHLLQSKITPETIRDHYHHHRHFPPPNLSRPKERRHFSAYAPYPPYEYPYPYLNSYQNAPAYDPYSQYYDQYDYGYEGNYDAGYHSEYGNAEKNKPRHGSAEKYKRDQKMHQDEELSSHEDPTKVRHSPSPVPPSILESNQTVRKKKSTQRDDEPSQSSKRSRRGKKEEKEAPKSKADIYTSSDPEEIQPAEPKHLQTGKRTKKATPKKRDATSQVMRQISHRHQNA